eukprot:CAMPEP_0114989224 /NCGR_PEP_ID=MMETSP0216-20121206/10074_1 /TAXON_ID=223996 /ORGANISM="Protocruzia adherens, Strain Boccale" /LENGTH=308 /DNA_ID=CAMNT_0002352169 /DNA_START=650 /DNA_END=1576 /DNA_ORIENTATION=+
MASETNRELSKKDELVEEQPESKPSSLGDKLKKIFFLCVIIGLFTFFIIRRDLVADVGTDFIDWLAGAGIWGPVVLILVYIVATLCFVPGLILTVGAGYAFTQAYNSIVLGIVVGSISVWIGAEIGSTLACILSRHVFRDYFEKKAMDNKTFKAIEMIIQDQGLKLVTLMRLSPLIPFNLLNYLLGTTTVTIREYMIGGFGMIPGTIAYVYLGATLNNIADVSSGGTGGGPVQLSLMIGGTIIAIVGVCYITYIAKKELKRIMDKYDEEEKAKEIEMQGATTTAVKDAEADSLKIEVESNSKTEQAQG